MLTTTLPVAAVPRAWHILDGAELRAALAVESLEAGLTADAARDRVRRFGPSVLPAPEPVSLGTIVLHQFLSPLICSRSSFRRQQPSRW